MSGPSPPTSATAGASYSPSKTSPLAKMTSGESFTPLMNLSDSPRTKLTTTTSPFDTGNGGNLSSANASANNLLQRARLAASLHSTSSPLGVSGMGGQTPMPATSTELNFASSLPGQRHGISSQQQQQQQQHEGVVDEECEQFERALVVLEQLGQEFYDSIGRVTGNQAEDVCSAQASLQTLLAHLQHLLTFAAQTSIGGLPVSKSSEQDSSTTAPDAAADTASLGASLSDQITALSDQGAALYNRLRGVRDASGIVASVVSGGRAR